MNEKKAIRWTIANAAAEFGINHATLANRIKRFGIASQKDGKYRTKDICAAVFGDIDGERLRETKGRADKLEIENAAAVRELIPAVLVQRVVDAVIGGLRQKISFLDIPDLRKQEILDDLQTIPLDEYFTTAQRDIEADAEEVPGPPQAAAVA